MTERDDNAAQPLDISGLTVDAVPSPETFGKPDHKASQDDTPRARRSRKLLDALTPPGDKADDTPKRAPRKPAARPRPRVPNKEGQFVEPLIEMYGFIGMGLMPIDPVCAAAILKAAPAAAKSLDDLAYKNEAVRRVLWKLTQTSALGAVIMAHAPILIAIGMHHVPAVQRIMGGIGQDFADNVEAEMRASQRTVCMQCKRVEPGDENGNCRYCGTSVVMQVLPDE